MPAYSTHFIFAKEMIESIEDIADFQVNKDAVFLGTQGADIFFFHRAMPWMRGKAMRKYGSLIHRSKPGVLFENMREYCKISENKEIAKSYVYGFLLHYALDRECHPYVYFLQNKITDKRKFANAHSVHNEIEFSMDLYLLAKRCKLENPNGFNTSSTLNIDGCVEREIGKLLEYVVPRTIGVSLTASDGEAALRDTKYIQKLTFDPCGIKRGILTVFETMFAPLTHNYKITSFILPKDLEKAEKYANINNGRWLSPFDGGERYESFENLFDLAKDKAIQMIKAFQSGKDCREITENKSFLTGVEVQ